MYKAASYPTGANLRMWPALAGIALNAQIAERTARYHLRQLEALHVIEREYSANSRIRPRYFRHTATYKLRLDRLVARPDYEHYKDSRPLTMPERKGPQREDEPPPAPPQLLPPAPPPSDAPPLTTRQRRELVQRIPRLMKGFKGSIVPPGSRDGCSVWVGPDDPAYREPMSKPEAILEACRSMCESDGVGFDRAIEAAADAGFVIEKGST